MDGSLMQNKQMYKGKLPKYNHIDDSGLESLYLALGKRSQFQQSQWQQLAEKGIPTNKHEDWKYTPLNLMIQPSRCWANRVMGIDDYLDARSCSYLFRLMPTSWCLSMVPIVLNTLRS